MGCRIYWRAVRFKHPGGCMPPAKCAIGNKGKIAAVPSMTPKISQRILAMRCSIRTLICLLAGMSASALAQVNAQDSPRQPADGQPPPNVQQPDDEARRRE